MSQDLREQLQSSLGDAYLLEHELGGGGMSRVFVAHETSMGRKVVVKVLLPELADAHGHTGDTDQRRSDPGKSAAPADPP